MGKGSASGASLRNLVHCRREMESDKPLDEEGMKIPLMFMLNFNVINTILRIAFMIRRSLELFLFKTCTVAWLSI